MNKTILFGLTATILMFSIASFANMPAAQASISLNSSKSNIYKIIGQIHDKLGSNLKAQTLLDALKLKISTEEASGVDNSAAINNAKALLTVELLKSKDPSVLALSKALDSEFSAYNSFKTINTSKSNTYKVVQKANQTNSKLTTITPNPACQSVKTILTNSGYSVTVIAKVMADMNCS